MTVPSHRMALAGPFDQKPYDGNTKTTHLDQPGRPIWRANDPEFFCLSNGHTVSECETGVSN